VLFISDLPIPECSNNDFGVLIKPVAYGYGDVEKVVELPLRFETARYTAFMRAATGHNTHSLISTLNQRGV